MLKAVIQAMPTYSKSVFQLPRRICKEIETTMARFWWGHKQNDRKIHWQKWENSGTTKAIVGLGFRQIWRLLIWPQSLVSQILKCKYFQHKSIFDAKLGYNPSFIWHSLYSSIELVREWSFWRVGNGHKIRVWMDEYLPATHSRCHQIILHCL